MNITLVVLQFRNIVLTLAIPLFAGSMQHAQAEQWKAAKIKTGASISDTLQQKLKSDLASLDTLARTGEADWNHTMICIEALLNSHSFNQNFLCRLTKMARSDYGIDLHWRDNYYPVAKVDWIPICTFLPEHEGRLVTLASFDDTDEPVCKEFPKALIELFKEKMRIFADEGNDAGAHSFAINFDTLAMLVPKLMKCQYFLVSETSMTITKIKSLEIVTASVGQNQIRAEFLDSLPGAVFAFPAGDGQAPPKIQRFDPTQYSSLMGNDARVITIPTPDSGLVYIGTKCPVPISISMLWDAKTHIIQHLEGVWGQNLGNENPCFEKNYLLEYQGKHLILLIDRRRADLVVVDASDLKILTIADETAPEM